MKRLVVVLIALVYLAVSSGFTVHVHYCMGHVVGASLLDEAGDRHACSKCGMKKKAGNGCCHHEQKIVKSDTDQSLVKSLTLPQALPPAILPRTVHLAHAAAVPEAVHYRLPYLHGPPWHADDPIYLRVRNLRI
jgi:hypothetical protein